MGSNLLTAEGLLLEGGYDEGEEAINAHAGCAGGALKGGETGLNGGQRGACAWLKDA